MKPWRRKLPETSRLVLGSSDQEGLFFWGGLQVTELKGLASHVLVGSVICETKELFTAMPQVVAVDVNDLGTIKLNLEVTWQ